MPIKEFLKADSVYWKFYYKFWVKVVFMLNQCGIGLFFVDLGEKNEVVCICWVTKIFFFIKFISWAWEWFLLGKSTFKSGTAVFTVLLFEKITIISSLWFWCDFIILKCSLHFHSFLLDYMLDIFFLTFHFWYASLITHSEDFRKNFNRRFLDE